MSSGCTVYTEKQSEALSQSVYATKDSIDQSRIDLAEKYANQATRIVKPPKKKIPISAIYLTKDNSGQEPKDKITIVPEKYGNQQAFSVNSERYVELLKNKTIYEQLNSDKKIYETHVENVEKELSKQDKYANQMVMNLNRLQKEIIEKNLLILRLYIAIAILSVIMAGGVYLRMKGIL